MDKHNLLHPPLHVKNLKNKDEALLIKGMKNGKFDVVFLDDHFKPLPKAMDVPAKDLSKFLDSHACQNLKAVFFVLANLDNKSHAVNLEIRQMVYEEVRKRKWGIYLVNPKRLSIMSMLLSSKIDSKPGDVILNVLCMGQMVCVSELQCKPEGYSYMSYRMINRFNRNVNDVAAEILETGDPKYVTVCDPYNNDLVMVLNIVSSKNVINIDPKGIAECTPQVLKTIFVRGCNQLISYSMDILAVTNESNFTTPEQAVITVDDYKDLPFEKIKIVPKSKKPYYVVFLDTISESYKPIGEAQLFKKQRGHRIKVALVVDRNSLPFLYQEPFIIPEIEALPQKLATQPDLTDPVIGFYDNSSVICVHDENGYMFLNEWNGLYGNDLYLSFEEEVPTIVTDMNEVKNKDPFFVYDLVKVLSMPAHDLKVDPKWGFNVITNDPEHPVLLQFETFLGSRKSSTPIFLMALFLKLHIKAIKKETGKKPTKLGFYLFNAFTKEEKKRIHTGLDESCKLLKIHFVFVTND